jgi:ABC-type antimicrobial peptide transport system permease subunit
MALGATSTDVIQHVLRSGLTLVVTGLAIGLAGAFAVTRLMSALLHGVSPTDPLIFASVPVVLALAAIAATYLPARRASRTHPMVALRYE